MNYITPNNYLSLPDDSAMIQAAVDEAAKNGDLVVIPVHNERTGKDFWQLEREIRLHTGSAVCLQGCHLIQSETKYHNVFTNSNFGTEKAYKKTGTQYDIHIYGVGNALIDGGNPVNELTEATSLKDGMPHVTQNSMFNFINTERIRIENIRIKNQKYWAFVFHYCAHVRISNIDFHAPNTFINQDGIDLRTGCSDFVIENISGCTGDDVVALTCLKSMYDEYMEPSFDTSINTVTIRNIQARTNYSLVRLLNHGGKKLYNIIVDGVIEDVMRQPAEDKLWTESDPRKKYLRSGAAVRIGENGYYGDGAKAEIGDTYNITVKNVVSRGRMAVRAACTLSESVIENVKVYDNGGNAVYFGDGEYKNILVRDIFYPQNVEAYECDDNRFEANVNNVYFDVDPNRDICAVYFKNAKAENMLVHNVFAGELLTSVFGGYGDNDVKVQASDIIRNNADTPILSGDGIDIKF